MHGSDLKRQAEIDNGIQGISLNLRVFPKGKLFTTGFNHPVKSNCDLRHAKDN